MKGSLSLEKLAHGHFVQRKSTKEGTARPQTSNDVDDEEEDDDAEEEEVDDDDEEEGDENFAVLTNAPLYTKENHQKRDHCTVDLYPPAQQIKREKVRIQIHESFLYLPYFT